MIYFESRNNDLFDVQGCGNKEGKFAIPSECHRTVVKFAQQGLRQVWKLAVRFSGLSCSLFTTRRGQLNLISKTRGKGDVDRCHNLLPGKF